MSAREQFVTNLEDNFASVMLTVRAKNEDYASGSDPFFNFREAAQFAGVSLESAILVRIGDKFGRYKNLLAKRAAGEGASVSDETVIDTLEDILGYVNVLTVWEAWKTTYVEGYLYTGAAEDYTSQYDAEDDGEVFPEEDPEIVLRPKPSENPIQEQSLVALSTVELSAVDRFRNLVKRAQQVK